MGSKKVRLLDLLAGRFPEESRKELYASAVCGEITVDGGRIREPNTLIDPAAVISREKRRFVSRGGLKLEHALTVWELQVADKIFLDAGSSAGGFTDCLLQHGAAAVHAVDVGYNQLDYSLRRDTRVILHERTNIMDVASLEPNPQAAAADLSFRSITGAAWKIISLTEEKWAVFLIKPQFEYAAHSRKAEKDTGFSGILTDPEKITAVFDDTLRALEEAGVRVLRTIESPIQGRKGNREFLALVGGAGCRI